MTTLVNGTLPLPKQIRFVNNQGQPPSKRRRINAACLTCRKRKTRCAGERPQCSTCTTNGHVCLGYNEAVEKRKGADGSLRRDAEAATADQGTELHDPLDEEEDDDDEVEEAPWKAHNAAKQNDHMPGSSTARRSSDSSAGAAPRPARPATHGNEWEHDFQQVHHQQDRSKRPSYARTVSFSEDSRSSNNRSPLQHHAERRKMPYFRYFGPTAIVPGYKQMVVNVSVRDRRRSMGGSFSAPSPGSAMGHPSIFPGPPHSETVCESLEDMPVYDPNDTEPVHPLIVSLVKTFFLHLGCNYPFLHESHFLRMLIEKRVESILVDAMCSLAARFSDLPIFTAGGDPTLTRSEYGQAFAQRAKAATVDTFPCPSVAAVQACLLIAYESFGANQDSALWMYLGIAIRMALDLGLQKMVGIKYQGERDPWYTRTRSRNSTGDIGEIDSGAAEEEDQLSPEEQQEIEQERIDTFWAVFILDRVISSGTGRPVTFRDDDFELALPEPSVDPVSGWPAPFPTFLEVIHLYGRASDVLNNIRDARDLTRDKMTKLAEMESDLTKIYQKQDARLHFNAFNFQEYVKAGQGTTFILLHFWFHALIIILHQPTLLAPFGNLSRGRQLSPTSRELSMSSAKTIADILAFAELIDPKSLISNPFTSQPIYIAACAFLMESVANASHSTSREDGPSLGLKGETNRAHHSQSNSMGDAKVSKHSLLASAANQNYQRCYKSLQQLHAYWGGVKYILTALDQKSKGIWDCETYTNEEYESARLPRRASLSRFPRLENPSSPSVPPIAWSLTGTTNSPNSSLTLLYPNIGANAPFHQAAPPQPDSEPTASASTPPGNMIYDPIRQSLPEPTAMFPPAYPQPNVSAVRYSAHPPRGQRLSTSSLHFNQTSAKSLLKYESFPPDDVERHTSETDGKHGILANMAQGTVHPPPPSLPAHSYTPSSHHSSNYEPSIIRGESPVDRLTDTGLKPGHRQHDNQISGHNPAGGGEYPQEFAQDGLGSGSYAYLGPGGPISDVITFDSQEIDIAAFGLPNEMMTPWLEYLPGDVLNLFEGGVNGTSQG